MVPSPIPQLVANNGTAALHAAIADPGRYACEPKVDGVRGLIAYGPDGLLETRNRTGIRRDWRRGNGFTGHEKPRQALLDRAALLGRETGATVILFDRNADMDPLMSPLPIDGLRSLSEPPNQVEVVPPG